MFDYICCELPIPNGRLLAKDSFQTKSLWRSMDHFTISAVGRLIYHKRRYVPPFGDLPQAPVHVADIDLDYHGDIEMHASTFDDVCVSYVARFTHGTAEWIRPLGNLPEFHRTWLLERG